MTIHHEPKYLNDVLLTQVQGLSLQNGVLAITAVALALGTVLAKKANGEYVPLDFSAAAPLNAPVAILAKNVEPSTTVQPILNIERLAKVASNHLIWPVGATEAQIKTALAALESSKMIVAEVAA